MSEKGKTLREWAALFVAGLIASYVAVRVDRVTGHLWLAMITAMVITFVVFQGWMRLGRRRL